MLYSSAINKLVLRLNLRWYAYNFESWLHKCTLKKVELRVVYKVQYVYSTRALFLPPLKAFTCLSSHHDWHEQKY